MYVRSLNLKKKVDSRIEKGEHVALSLLYLWFSSSLSQFQSIFMSLVGIYCNPNMKTTFFKALWSNSGRGRRDLGTRFRGARNESPLILHCVICPAIYNLKISIVPIYSRQSNCFINLLITSLSKYSNTHPYHFTWNKISASKKFIFTIERRYFYRRI